ncbi:glycosyltransferase family 2 protein [Methylobacterium gregans]|uniref:glycosyltransferase family 2 protein n=1 Tax=Methylobacterium gregans TaxID=374424 RepID=UPI00360CADFB
MRVVAILASHNEEVYVRACLDTYIAQGVEVYLIDNDSTDRTVEIARTYLGRGLIGIERFPRNGTYEWLPILRRKEEIADAIRADWYIHADMDEIRLPRAGRARWPGRSGRSTGRATPRSTSATSCSCPRGRSPTTSTRASWRRCAGTATWSPPTRTR